MTRTQKKKHALRQSADNTFELKTWHCVTFLVLLVAFFFKDHLLGTAWLWEDFLYFSYPLRCFAATSMAQGQMPLWNPYIFNGMPFLADIQTAVFYLPVTALSLFVKNGNFAPYWLQFMMIAHYPLAGGAMYLLARSFSLRRIPSLFAGAAYMLSGFMITHAIHQQIITLVAWYPLVFFLFRKVLTTSDWRWVFACALVLGHSIFAGYPQLSLYLYFVLFLYYVYTIFTDRPGGSPLSAPSLRMSMRAAVVIVISLAVAMIQFLPTFELADLSVRAQITFAKASEGSFAWSQLLTLIYPKLFGSAGAHGYNYWGPGTYWYYWETCLYVGILPFVLLLISPFVLQRNRHLMFFWGVALFAVLFALGDNFFLTRVFYEFIPGFSKFRIPARMGIWFTFAVSIVSAFVLDNIMYGGAPPRAQTMAKRVLMVVAGVAAMVWLLVSSGSAFQPPVKSPQFLDMLTKELNISLVIVIASLSLLWVIIVRVVSLRVGLSLLLVVFFLDVYHFGGDQNTSDVNPEQYFNRSERLVTFLKNGGNNEIFRVNTRSSRGMIMDRNQGMVDRIFTMEGYTPLVLQRVYPPVASDTVLFDLLNAKFKTGINPATGALTLEPNPTYLPRAFFLYDLHITRSEEELNSYLKSREFGPHVTAVLEEDPGMTLSAGREKPQWKADITEYENNRIALDVETDRKGILVLSEMYYPGWSVTIDGNEAKMYRTDYNLRGVFVNSGSHTVVWTFLPEPYKRGRLITLSSLVLCFGGIAISTLRQRRRNPPTVQQQAG